jgi:uncharacterized membrane protein YvbJ
MENFDKKIEKTLSSLDGLKQVEMPLDLEQKIKQQIANQRIKSTRIVPFRTILLAAAVFAGIVILNVVSILSANTTDNNRVGERVQKMGVQAFATAYFNDSSLNY